MNHVGARQSVTRIPLSSKWTQPGPTIPGNDIYHGNVPVQWGQAVFTWIKATQGTGFHDPRFLHSSLEAKSKGIYRGAYHYFTQDDPIAQARFFVTTVNKQTDLGYALDWEEHPKLVTQAIAFKQEVEQLTGRPLVIYSYLAFLEDIGGSALAPFANNPLWLADLSHGGPHIPLPWKVLTYWQYKFGQGNLPDQDVFYGQLSDLKAQIK